MSFAQNQLDELGKRQNDPRKNVNQFMSIEGKKNINEAIL